MRSYKDNASLPCKGRPEKVGVTTKKSWEKEAKGKKRRTIILNNGRERKKFQFLEASGRN